MPVSGEVERRGRRGWSLALCVYVGLPLVFLGAVYWIGSASERAGGSFNYQALVVPLVMLAIGVLLARRNRYRPARWAGGGAWFGGITGLTTAFYSIVIDIGWLASLFPLAAVVGAGLGWAVGKSAERAITTPAIPELAESPYELVYRVRSPRNLRLTIGTESLSVKERITVGSGSDTSETDRGQDYPLDTVTGAHEVLLTGAERLKFPVNLRTPPFSTPGPALILQVRAGDWVLPLDEAHGIAAIITRRVAAARRPR